MVVVLGAGGMLGHKVFQVLRAQCPDTVATIRRDPGRPPLQRVDLLQGPDVFSGVDVTDFPALRGLLTRLQPAFIVNCAGLIKQRAEATAALPSITVNALLPHLLCEWTRSWGGRVVHVSTDCVFAGTRGHYCEEDPSDATDLYGRTKFLGEVTGGNALTLRTSFIGRELSEHRSLLEWVLAQQGKVIRGFSRVVYSGVTTNYLARLVCQLIQAQPHLSGLYHVASEAITKHALLCRLNDVYDLNITIEQDPTEKCDRSLAGERFVSATGIVTPSWEDLLRDLRDNPTPYDDWMPSPREQERNDEAV